MKPITLVRVLLFAAALTPAAALAYGFYRLYYGIDFNALTANPGDYITDQTGTWALGCLAASLSVTPLRRLTGWNEIIKARRMLGLFAFFYATLHMLTWVVFIHYFDVSFMVEDVVKRFARANRPGAYLRIAEAGAIEAGEAIEIVERPEHELTMARFSRAR